MTIKSVFFNTRDAYIVGHGTTSETYGGINLNFNFDDQMIDDLIWLRKFRETAAKEQTLRTENPALESAWQQYQTMLNIVLDTH